MSEAKIEAGVWVNVCAGPHCGANGEIDFVDERGMRALVGRDHGDLVWIPFDCLRAYDGSPLRGGAVLRHGKEKA